MREGMATGEYKELASYLRAVATIMMDDKTSDANINDTVPLRQDHEDARPRDNDYSWMIMEVTALRVKKIIMMILICYKK